MGSYFLKILFAVLVCFLHTKVSILGFNLQSQSSHVKCIERERQALLNFKQSLIDISDMLSTWKDNGNNGDCCKWRGVECNNETGHVSMLDLRGNVTEFLGGAISFTSLFELQNMEYLDLSHNIFSDSQIPEHMGSFKNIRYLNLSGLRFFGRIPHQLGNLYKLEYLDLKANSLDGGTIPSQLGKLTILRYLDLSNNFIPGEIPYQLGNLSQLRYLDISNNHLDGAIPYQLGNLSRLRYLDLQETFLSGAIPFQVGNLPILHTLRLDGNFDLKINNAKWLSSLSSLTTLVLESFSNLGSSQHWLQMINELIPSLRELRLVHCSLSDHNLSSLFRSHSKFSVSLSILDLSDNMLTSSAFQLLFNCSLNLQELYLSQNNVVLSSLHYPDFPSLDILDLSNNNMTSSVFQGNFNFISEVRKLYLSGCSLTDKNFLVPSAFIQNSSSSLVTLDLSNNLMKSEAIFHWLFNFTTNLHSLTLFGNLLERVPGGFAKVMNSLEFLHLSYNKFQGEIPVFLGNICTLKELHLSYNNFSGEISSFIQNSSWCNRHVFQSLLLSKNQITGVLPDLSNFTSLRILDLSNNQLTGEIPRSIGLLNELQYLHLDGNHLEGDINESHLTNLSQLRELDLTDNSLSLRLGTTWVPSFQLLNLGLGSCKLGPSFPSWLQTQKYISFLDISDAGIDDFVPEWFWNKLQYISEMNMSYNSLKGTIPNLPIKLNDDITLIFILNSNQLEGGIPAFLSQADTLDLSKNKISDLKTFLCGNRTTASIRTLDLSNNQILGQLPDCWEHLTSLKFLDLGNNKLSGKIPQSMSTLIELEALVLRNNNLSGELPLTLKNCSSLVILVVSENLLSGPVPSWIGESLQKLKILSLRVNNFFGSIPVHLCYLSQIQVLDLSRNNLSGGIPTCLRNFTAMTNRSVIPRELIRKRKISAHETYFNIYDSNVLLTWKGQEYLFLNPEYLLKSIDLSSNDLTGEVPQEVVYLLGLVSLNLSRNYFSGEIPSDIGNLNSLEFLDLSRNHFSGKIPSTLSKIDRLAVLDLSNNSLIGRIPWGRQFQTFDASSFEGNIGLCGELINKSCPGDETTVKPQGPAFHGEDDNSVFYEALYMSLGLGFFTGFWGLLGSMLLWQAWRNAYLRFLNRLADYILVMVDLKLAKCHRWLKG